MNKINKMALFLFLISCTITVTAQVSVRNLQPGQTIEKFMTMALAKCQSRLSPSPGTNEMMTFQIMVMRGGDSNNKTPRNNDGWYVAYGEAQINMESSADGKAIFPATPRSSNGNVSTLPGITAKGDVHYWFSDQTFNEQGKREGEFLYTKNFQGARLSLDTKGKWQVTKAVMVGDILYGELNNGTLTFSLSYGAYHLPRVN